jgi:CheY-like chemotaxis protein
MPEQRSSHTHHEPWRILLVEDDPIIAIMLGDMLHELSCNVVGPAGSVSAALALLLSSGPIDGAVVDWNLGRETTAPVAEELLERSIPFVFSTGYGAERIRLHFNGIPVLTKPYNIIALRQGLIPLLRSG